MMVSIYDGFKLISEPYVVLAKRRSLFDAFVPMGIVSNETEAQDLIKQLQKFAEIYTTDKIEYQYLKVKYVRRIADET